MGSKVVPDLGSFTYVDGIYATNMQRGQKELAAEVLERMGDLPVVGKSRTYFVKMRKEYLAAIVSDWHTTVALAVVDELLLRPERIKPEGMTSDLHVKQRRPRMPLSKGGTSRKYRRQYTKNKFRNQRGIHRLQLAQATLR